MAKAAQHIPPGYGTLTVHLTVPGCADYIEFLKRAFNAVEIGRSPGPGGKLMHANVKTGDPNNVGAVDLAIDPKNPRVLYASLWATRRPPWSVSAPRSERRCGVIE